MWKFQITQKFEEFLPTISAAPLEKLGKKSAYFWVIRKFHINLTKNGL